MKPVDVLADVVASPISTNPSLRTTTLYPSLSTSMPIFSSLSLRFPHVSFRRNVPHHSLIPSTRFIRADSALYNLILQSRKAVKATDFTSHRDARACCTQPLYPAASRAARVISRTILIRTRNVEFRGVARVTTYSLAIFNDAEESFHSNLTGMHVCTCREYKARENLSLVALASAIPELRSCAMAAPSDFAVWK